MIRSTNVAILVLWYFSTTTSSLAFTPSARLVPPLFEVILADVAAPRNHYHSQHIHLKHRQEVHHFGTRLMTSSSYSNEDSTDETGDKIRNKSEEGELTLPKIAELIDCSFVQACMQLADGYIDVLKLMIASIQSAFDKGIPPAHLIQAIEDIQPGSAGRMLMPEEIRLRNTWIQVVYVMLAHLAKQKLPELLDTDIEESYVPITPILIRRKELSDSFHAKELFEATAQFFPKDLSANPLEEAIVLQSLRVMWVTMTVVDEVELCQGEFARMDAKLKPQPPIPGAFD